MKLCPQHYGLALIVLALLAGITAGCSPSNSEASKPAPAAPANLTPQQQEGAKASAQRDGEMRAAAARLQQSAPH